MTPVSKWAIKPTIRPLLRLPRAQLRMFGILVHSKHNIYEQTIKIRNQIHTRAANKWQKEQEEEDLGWREEGWGVGWGEGDREGIGKNRILITIRMIP